MDLLHSKNDVCRALQCPSFKHSLGIFPSLGRENTLKQAKRSTVTY